MTSWAIHAAAAAMAAASLAGSAASAQPAPAPDAERTRLAGEVFQAIGGADALEASMRSALDAAAAQLPKTGSAKDQADAADMQRFVVDRITFYTPAILQASEAVYAREFTAPQLRDVLGFYRSPTGQALARKLPDLSREAVVALRPVMVRLQRDVLAHACQLSTCTAAQQATLAALQKAAG